MATRVLVELLLFLTPFAVFLVYRAASRDMMIRDRWPLTQLVLVGAAIAVAALIITPLLEPSESTKCFEPVRYVDSQVIPAKEVACEAKPQETQADPNATQHTAPIAPRDQADPTPKPTPPKPLTPSEQGG